MNSQLYVDKILLSMCSVAHFLVKHKTSGVGTSLCEDRQPTHIQNSSQSMNLIS
ncbi:hypothetical protein Hanom_Chr15g01351011 [Helianthus anomalus]